MLVQEQIFQYGSGANFYVGSRANIFKFTFQCNWWLVCISAAFGHLLPIDFKG